MKNHPLVRPLLKRVLLLAVISIGFIGVMSEAAFLIQGRGLNREPQTIEIVIPAGTNEQIAAGGKETAFQQDMSFVVGDTLVLRNEDNVAHQLGPLWVPAQASASLVLDQKNDYAYSCSFVPTKIMGISVRAGTTWRTRLAALGYGVPPTLMFLLVYSFVVSPLKPQKPDRAGQ